MGFKCKKIMKHLLFLFHKKNLPIVLVSPMNPILVIMELQNRGEQELASELIRITSDYVYEKLWNGTPYSQIIQDALTENDWQLNPTSVNAFARTLLDTAFNTKPYAEAQSLCDKINSLRDLEGIGENFHMAQFVLKQHVPCANRDYMTYPPKNVGCNPDPALVPPDTFVQPVESNFITDHPILCLLGIGIVIYACYKVYKYYWHVTPTVNTPESSNTPNIDHLNNSNSTASNVNEQKLYSLYEQTYINFDLAPMTAFLLEYRNILVFITCSFVLSIVLLAAVYILSFTSKVDLEKSSAYECGFQPFSETSYPFEVQFAVIAIMFLLFDIEVLYLFPLVNSLYNLLSMDLIVILTFYVLLLLGILFEITRKVLDFQTTANEH
jgi:NADH-quinone oxidoreductase subunit A